MKGCGCEGQDSTQSSRSARTCLASALSEIRILRSNFLRAGRRAACRHFRTRHILPQVVVNVWIWNKGAVGRQTSEPVVQRVRINGPAGSAECAVHGVHLDLLAGPQWAVA